MTFASLSGSGRLPTSECREDRLRDLLRVANDDEARVPQPALRDALDVRRRHGSRALRVEPRVTPAAARDFPITERRGLSHVRLLPHPVLGQEDVDGLAQPAE